MDFRNKYLIITVRTLLGLLFIFSGVTGFMAGLSGMEGVPEANKAQSQALWDMGIFQMIKVTELVAGVMLLFGLFPALAVLFLAPVAVGIIVFNAMVSPAYLITGIIVGLLLAYLGYAYWDRYSAIFRR